MAAFGGKTAVSGFILLCGVVLGGLLIWKSRGAKRILAAWPAWIRVVDYPCIIDSSLQKAMYLPPQGAGPRP